MIQEEHYARCDGCGTTTGRYGSKRGLQKAIDRYEWRTTLMKVYCPSCNDKSDEEWAECKCNNCDYETETMVGSECRVCEEGEHVA